jgi:hypothetical protein
VSRKGVPRGLNRHPGDEVIACMIESVVYRSDTMEVGAARALGTICNILRDRAESRRQTQRRAPAGARKDGTG